MKKQTINQRIHALIPLFAIAMLAVPVCRASVVFSDDFSETPGTLIVGKSPDVGSAWTGNGGATPGPLAVSANNTLNTAGDARAVFGAFTTTLGPGEMITLSYDTINFGNNFDGYGGVSLYSGGSGGTEQVFTGDLGNYNSWGVDGAAIGNIPANPQNMVGATSATFTYVYDTGAWSLTTLNGVNLSGIGTASVALDTLRIANGNNGDINLDNLVVDISPVPEPSSMALAAMGVGLLFILRRRPVRT
ncbi:MAG TPA: PEP-CTERM sorting domain-containing protein [Candidatus Binatia bacterium]|nr:PEP-CTERM sorting domain-containing protein [Candidatus Binatia bacterium]